MIAESANGHRVALLADEAQNMDNQILENLRLFSNIETSQEKLLYIILLGQPELREKLNLRELRQFKQRISLGYTLKPLMATEVPLYIAHRLKVAGSVQGLKLFSDKSLSLIAHYSKGIPRIINSLCDNALLTGYALERYQIDDSLIREAATDLMLDDTSAPFFQREQFLSNQSLNTEGIVPHLTQKKARTSHARLLVALFLVLALISFAVSQIKWPLMDYETFVNEFISKTKNATNQLLDRSEQNSEPVAASVDNEKETGQKKKEQELTQTKEEPINKSVEETYSEDKPSLHSLEEVIAPALVENPPPDLEDSPSKVEGLVETKESKEPEQPEEPVKEPISAATVRIIKSGDSITKLTQEVYGTISDDLLCLIHFANPRIENMNVVSRGQRVVFPSLNPESMVFKQEDGRYRAFIAASRDLSQAARWQTELGDRGIPARILPVNLTPSMRNYVLFSDDHELRDNAVKTVKEASASPFIKQLKEGGYE